MCYDLLLECWQSLLFQIFFLQSVFVFAKSNVILNRFFSFFLSFFLLNGFSLSTDGLSWSECQYFRKWYLPTMLSSKSCTHSTTAWRQAGHLNIMHTFLFSVPFKYKNAFPWWQIHMECCKQIESKIYFERWERENKKENPPCTWVYKTRLSAA